MLTLREVDDMNEIRSNLAEACRTLLGIFRNTARGDCYVEGPGHSLADMVDAPSYAVWQEDLDPKGDVLICLVPFSETKEHGAKVAKLKAKEIAAACTKTDREQKTRTTPPFASGPCARVFKPKGVGKDNPVHVGSWLIHYPGVHAVWSWWAWSLVSLADHEGVGRATLQFEGATHELIGFALNPETEAPPNVTTWPSNPEAFLVPADLVTQFQVDGDAAALRLVEEALHAMVMGNGPPPDGDYRRPWEKILGELAKRSRGDA